jgi:integrase
MVPGFDPKNERVHARRKATPEQLATILDAALNSERPFKRMNGADRYALYLTAFSTGFRASELASLTPESFDLFADPPAVSLGGRSAKNKKAARQPIPPAVAVQLARHLAGKPAGERVWPGAWHRHGARMLRGDLKAAGLPYAEEVNGEKRFLDFHALRASFISALAEAGIGPKELQELARHSDPRLTLGVYTHVTPKQLAGAVGRLPLPGGQTDRTPYAHLSREHLEAALAVALSALAGLLPGTVTPLVTPAGDSPGEALTHAGAIGEVTAVAGHTA